MAAIKITELKAFLRRNALKSNFVAQEIGMHPTLLSQYMAGKKVPSKEQLDRIEAGIREIGRKLSEAIKNGIH